MKGKYNWKYYLKNRVKILKQRKAARQLRQKIWDDLSEKDKTALINQKSKQLLYEDQSKKGESHATI